MDADPPAGAPAIDLAVRRDLGGLLDATFELWGRNLPAFLSLSLVIVAPIAIAVTAITRSIQPDIDRVRDQLDANQDPTVTGSLVVGVLAILALSLLQGPLITATHARAVVHLSHHPSIGFLPALRAGLAVLPVALLAELLAGLLTLLATLALVLPGIWVGIRLYFATQAAAVDRAGVRAALGASWGAVRGSWWRTFAILALFWLMAAVASAIFERLLTGLAHAVGYGSLSLAIAIIGQAVTASLLALGATLLFFDLRARHAPAPREEEVPAW